ncbi:hypothetical protein UNSWDHB_956 [Dehalobacter sp. UNSWDHB]|uniref:flagellar protein FlgN n=1 Tax=unclassified Dehalobacter TaxID=2635733 RepID=UPI00028AA0E2|nr:MULTISPECIES: flagellar protein FlgN [unclassified Dehalobacter]AFV02600.1 FlgN protein [Dehalobacter sp. DCA]AFV05586.1 FlgN protein [Dehalobacter sp. CF]EQB21752.1 hypothetical protein UNSWDHB_956 [Dehalobacter sp. UNSWDHB]
MAEYVAGLENNLQQQIAFYRQLVELEQEKQKALVDNVIEKIESITAQEEKILLEVGQLEEERLYWAEFFGKEVGKKAEDITLTDLIQYSPGFEPIGQEFEKAISQLKNLHEINAKLLKSALSIADFTLRLLTGQKHTTYSNPSNKGVKNEFSQNNLINKSI